MKTDGGFHAFFRGIILFGFTMLILSMILTGSIRYYIAPSMMPFIYFALGVFFILSVLQIIRSMPKSQREEEACDCGAHHQMTGSVWKKAMIYSIFILPLLMGFVFPDRALDSSVADKRGIQIGGTHEKKPEIERAESPEPKQDESESPSTSLADDYLASLEEDVEEIEHDSVEDTYTSEGFDDDSTLAEEWLEEDLFIITDENFLDAMNILDVYMYEFIGKQIQLEGFVFREPGMEQDEMVVARFSMTCCTADSAVYGLLVQGEETRQFENDSWVRATGVLDVGEFDEWLIPSLVITEIEGIEEPESPYVFPSYW